MSTLEMKEIIKNKIDNIQDQELLNKINELLKTTEERESIEEIYNKIVLQYGDTLKKLAQ